MSAFVRTAEDMDVMHGPRCLSGSLRPSRCDICRRVRADVLQGERDEDETAHSLPMSCWVCVECLAAG